MKSWQRSLVSLLVGLAFGVSVAAPALAENKRELLVSKVEFQVAVGKVTLESHVAAILANVEEDFGWTVGP